MEITPIYRDDLHLFFPLVQHKMTVTSKVTVIC